MQPRWVFVIALLALPAAAFGQVKVLMSAGFSAAYRDILPDFQKTTGITVTTAMGQSQGDSPNAIGVQLRRGVPADVLIMSKEGLNQLIAEGKIVPGTNVDLAQTPIGVSVRAGAPKPDIGTVEAFRQFLLRAKSITFPNSTTGIYMMTTLFPKLGIADRVAGKISHTGVAAVASGDAEVAVQPVSELLHIAGTDFVGTIPADAQYISVFSTAIVAGSSQSDLARRLIAFLFSEAATKAIRNSGMEPLSSPR